MTNPAEMPAPKTTKICAGYYERKAGSLTVTIDRLEEGSYTGWWISRAEWDRWTYSDPKETKREAVEAADQMIAARLRGEI